MKYNILRKLTLTLGLAGTLFSIVNAQKQEVSFQAILDQKNLETINTLIKQIKDENPINQDALENIKSEVIKVAKEAGFSLTDFLILSSFSDRFKTIAGRYSIIFNAFAQKFIENILPKHEQTIIEIMQEPALTPVRSILDEQLESFDLCNNTQTVKKALKSASDIEQKKQKLSNFINDYQGQFHKILSVVLTVGAYAEALCKQATSHSYQELFEDIKNTVLEVAAEHLENAEIDHLIRFAKSNAYQKLATRYEQLIQVLIKVLKPKYQEVASSFWNQTKPYVSTLVAATA